MADEMRLQRETYLAHVTDVRFLPAVGQHVRLQVPLPLERRIALQAGKRFLSDVRSVVARQLALPGETGSAGSTRMGFVSGVLTHMRDQIRPMGERHVAELT